MEKEKNIPNKVQKTIALVTSSAMEFENHVRMQRHLKSPNRFIQIKDRRSGCGYRFDDITFLYGFDKVPEQVVREIEIKMNYKPNKFLNRRRSKRNIALEWTGSIILITLILIIFNGLALVNILSRGIMVTVLAKTLTYLIYCILFESLVFLIIKLKFWSKIIYNWN